MKVFITGASSGIGEALAREIRRRDPQAVIGICARREQRLAELATELGAQMTPAWTVDVADAPALTAAAEEFIVRFGAPDVVIANAGISHGTITGEPRDAPVFRQILHTNVIAMFDTFAAFLPAMRDARRGCLVGIASVAGVRGLPGAGAYSASKAAAITYLESLRVELRGQGLDVVTILPGYIRTPMTDSNRYRMPFLTDADVFAQRAFDAILARRRRVVIPWQMGIVAALLRLLPGALFDRLFARAPRKARAAGSQ
jgi:short-subunit dehydrogenase